MAIKSRGAGQGEGDLSSVKRKLILRMVFAVLMIIALLGGLALFDHFSNPAPDDDEREAVPPRFTEPVPVPKKKVDPPPVEPPKPEEPKVEESKPEEQKPEEPKPEEPKAVEPKTEAPETVEPKPAESQTGTSRIRGGGSLPPASRPSTPPASRPPVSPVSTPPALSVPESTAAPVDKAAPKADLPPRPEVTALPVLPRASTTPSSAPTVATKPDSRTPIAAQASASTQVPTSTTRLYSGFALQAGVFTDPRRAEELHARLTLEGIPSTIEARVQVGPFKNKAELEAAQAKLKTLGISAVVLTPPKGRR